MGESVGGRVGYQVGMESRSCSKTQILFMTTGIFLMRLVNNPDSLEKYSHIIMDEVHERDLDIDFSLVVIKHLLSRILNAAPNQQQIPGSLSNLKFKLILMSATFNTELFKHYFSRTSICDIEKKQVYEGALEKQLAADYELQQRIQREWGPAAGKNAWDNLGNDPRKGRNDDTDMEDEDQWVETKEDEKRHQIPVVQTDDPAEMIEINARMFKI